MQRRSKERKRIRNGASVADLMVEYKLSRDQVYRKTSRYEIPKKKMGTTGIHLQKDTLTK